MINITKAFPGIIANDNITLKLKKGEIHALSGENGAGKSTLMSILFGIYKPEKGQILKEGEAVNIKNPCYANALGIGMVHQQLRLVESFTVLENIILGKECTRFGFLAKKESRRRVLEISDRYALNLNPDAKVEDVSLGMRQRTEIAKMLYRDNEILIFDEPTSMLTDKETENLMTIMKKLKNEGKSILFITHKLDEIMNVADRVTVLRKGKAVATLETEKTDKESLSSLMLGRPIEIKINKKKSSCDEVVLEVDNISVKSGIHTDRRILNNVSFQVHKGEILSVAGIDGNGQTELAEAVAGLTELYEGRISVLGNDITRLSVKERNNRFISYIPEDRYKHGLVLDFTLADNMILKRYNEREFQQFGFILKENVKTYAKKLIKEFSIHSAEGCENLTRNMSGGNQQKLIIARELSRNMPLIVAVQPTRGLDAATAKSIQSLLIKKRNEGYGVLLITLEIDEVMNLSDRILVISEGEITGEFLPKKTTAKELGLYMSGVKKGRSSDE